MLWLITSDTKNAIERGTPPDYRSQVEYSERVALSSNDLSYSVGSEQIININGVITKQPDLMSELFGGGNTTYAQIIDAINRAESSKSIDRITLAIDSPGGQFDGLFDAIAAIQNTTKPVKAIISNLGASAAYALASQADQIIASSVATRVGSVGVAVTMGVYDDEVTITSTNAPKKRPDVSTDDGVAMVREELDALHEIFIDAIASGRGITPQLVNQNYGQGGVLLAKEALRRGMIDGILQTNSINKTEQSKMDLNTLQTQHADLYAEVLKLGVMSERDRVTAHLTMGESSGDTKTAFAAIKDGSIMTATLQATYLMAGMNKRDMENRSLDDKTANAGDHAAHDSGGSDDSNVVALVAKNLGVDL